MSMSLPENSHDAGAQRLLKNDHPQKIDSFPKKKQLSRNYWSELRKSKKGMTGGILVVLFVVIGIMAPLIAPKKPTDQNPDYRFTPPAFLQGGTREFLLGTDNLGRDILSRTIYGTRISISIAFFVILFSTVVGAILGGISGYYGGFLDNIIMRIGDFQLSFPFILLALVFMAILGPGFTNLLVALSVALWVNYARLVRGETLKLRELEFVQAAKAIGVPNIKIILGHIIPNALPSLIVLATLDIAWVIIFEAALSFMGLGIQPPTPSWGVLLNDARSYLIESPWMTIFPGSALFVTCVGVNLFGDWLRDTFDPKLFRL